MDELKFKIDSCAGLLATDKAVSQREAEKRAGAFLEILAHIVNGIDTLSDEKIKAQSLQAVVFAQTMALDTTKGVTEKKINVEANPDYITAREHLEGVENDLTYLKTYFKIFENGHLFYRQLAKAEYNG
jgi:hypothetical protein